MNIDDKNTAIKIHKLRKVYKNRKSDSFEALKGIDLNIPKKSIYGLLGPNGAGKSTLINIIAGLVIKTEGEVIVWGNNLDDNNRDAKLAIGVVPQELVIDPFSPIKLLHETAFAAPEGTEQPESRLCFVFIYSAI